MSIHRFCDFCKKVLNIGEPFCKVTIQAYKVQDEVRFKGQDAFLTRRRDICLECTNKILDNSEQLIKENNT